ncbi:MAG: hypothetical protein KJT01_00855 [Gemmatimonadetes bacterium]|nr:hypothetical protein [Gemmatimonadota bacterium]
MPSEMSSVAPEAPATPPHPLPHEAPLPRWAMEAVTRVVEDAEGAVPAAAMWEALGQRRPPHRALARWRTRLRPALRVAALLTCGVAIGRYGVPWLEARTGARSSGRPAPLVVRLDTEVAPAAPARAVLAEHVARTVALLTTVSSSGTVDTMLAPRARELLITTRLLMDDPGAQDPSTRRLLLDLELVLVQVMQARPVPAALARAPRETIREANLLPRLRALIPGTDTLVVNAGGE